MEYTFDLEIDRIGTNSLKWEFRRSEAGPLHPEPTELFQGPDRILPLWVADMDFRSPEPVVEALVNRASHGIYGYTAPTQAVRASVVDWMRRRHGWDVRPEWIVFTPGLVPALHMLVQTFSSAGEKVLIQPPVYYPFFRSIETNDRIVLENPLLYSDNSYAMDLQDLEEKAADPSVAMAILSSPHNPVGRLWTEQELEAFGEICLAHDVLVVSDEIHADLVIGPNKFIPFAAVNPQFAERCVVCTGPSKTFNLPGLQISCIIIPNPDLRAKFESCLERHGLVLPNAFGVVALMAAYQNGEEWLARLLDYIAANLDYLEKFVSERMPSVKVVRPQATYLVWLDFRGLGIDSADLNRILIEEAKVYLDDGSLFGTGGEGFQRLNIACPRSILAEALERIARAVDGL